MSMVEMPKNKEEFECEMRRRKDEYGWGGGLRYYISVDKDGTPLRKRDMKAICEIQKLALGGDKTWMECGPVEQMTPLLWGRIGDHWPEVDGANFVREVRLFFPTQRERNEMDKLFSKLVGADLIYTHDGGTPYENEGVSCAYPGGCD